MCEHAVVPQSCVLSLSLCLPHAACLQTSLRVKSATAAAKKSVKQFVSSSSGSIPSGSGKLQHAADAVAAESGAAAASTAAGDTAAAGPGQHDGAGPWSADPRSPSPAGSDGQGAAAAGAGDVSPVTAAARGQQGAAAAPYLDVQQAGVPAAAAASGSSFLSGWLGSWIWAEASAQEPPSASASLTPQAATRHVSGSSPWATGSGEDVDEDEDGWDSRQESVGGLSSSSSPLALLSHVVLLQKELEQQRKALSAMQQQLDHTSNRCDIPASPVQSSPACSDTLGGLLIHSYSWWFQIELVHA